MQFTLREGLMSLFSKRPLDGSIRVEVPVGIG